ncbi:MAG: hypothetical protein JST53_01635 [Actinobacteria bacterium]|nr:hypothetical protein [Actinomycetota bacterium]
MKRTLLFVVFATALLVGLTAVPSKTLAGEEPWYEKCNELPPDQVEACFYEHNGEKQPSERERRPTSPEQPIRAYIADHGFRADGVFVNCPKADAVGGDALGCEFRFLRAGRIVKGHAGVLAEAGRISDTAWHLTSFHAERPVVRTRHRCALPPRRIAPGGDSLVVRGVSCKEAQDRAWRAESLAQTASNLRLPSRFQDGDPHTDTIGFVVTSYRCRGTTVVRPPVRAGLDPFGEETARCRNRFGDQFTYTFVVGN